MNGTSEKIKKTEKHKVSFNKAQYAFLTAIELFLKTRSIVIKKVNIFALVKLKVALLPFDSP